MKANSNIILEGLEGNIILVPYLEEHVLQYHEWMKSEYLQETTASEPLTLEQEYEMQKSWAQDEEKCTFIIHSPLMKNTTTGGGGAFMSTSKYGGGMVGDCNLYWNIPEEPHTAEIELMIAEPEMRRKGLGRETLLIFMDYAARYLKVTKFVAKISLNNHASLNLFQNTFGFEKESVSSIFNEITLVKQAAISNEQEEPSLYKVRPLN